MHFCDEIDLTPGCPGCDEAANNACDICGYGHAFTWHDADLHIAAGDPDFLVAPIVTVPAPAPEPTPELVAA